MTSFIRNRIFEFLSQNGYAENNIQKGFTPKIAGTIEHTSHMGHLIRHAKKHQRALVITLIDLKNAFGEVHHNLINCILEYHHIPRDEKFSFGTLYWLSNLSDNIFVLNAFHCNRKSCIARRLPQPIVIQYDI